MGINIEKANGQLNFVLINDLSLSFFLGKPNETISPKGLVDRVLAMYHQVFGTLPHDHPEKSDVNLNLLAKRLDMILALAQLQKFKILKPVDAEEMVLHPIENCIRIAKRKFHEQCNLKLVDVIKDTTRLATSLRRKLNADRREK